MISAAHVSWVAVGSRLEPAVLESRSDTAWFAGDPLALEILPAATRRVPETALHRCLELLRPIVGDS